MSKRTRVPGPMAVDQTLGNTDARQPNGISKWITIDVNDGDWTKYDPNNNIVSVVTSTSGMRIVFDNATSNLRWNATNQQCGRWYQKLIGPDGNELSWTDFFTLEIMIQCVAQNANTDPCDKHGIVVGIAGDGITDSTSSINWAGQGALLHYTNSNALRSVIGGDTGTTNGNDPDCVKVYGQVSAPIDDDNATDEKPSTRHLWSELLNSSNKSTNNIRPSAQTHKYTLTDPVYLFLSGNFGSTVAGIDDPDATWKVWYRVNLARDGLSPTYIPGGGVSG